MAPKSCIGRAEMTDKKTPRLAGQTEASPLHAKEHAWSGRFSEPVAQFVLDYTASVGFDRRLAPADIQASLAHASMLAAAGVLGAEDLTQIRQGLAQVLSEIESGAFHWQLALEDVHLNVERRLTEIAGD